MVWTCCICNFKFDEIDYDTSERMCHECLLEFYANEED